MGNKKQHIEHWQQCDTKVFWGEIAPREHVVQIYKDEQNFLDLLEGYVTDGFEAGETVILILTEEHRYGLYSRLAARETDLNKLIVKQQFIALNAERTLKKFMVNGLPDEALFTEVINELVGGARKNGRPVRAFGEMVALLWAQGLNEATVHLEHLWDKVCEKENFTLFCAYPQSGFTGSTAESMMHICGKHSKLISSISDSTKELQYQDTRFKKAM